MQFSDLRKEHRKMIDYILTLGTYMDYIEGSLKIFFKKQSKSF